jgi:hypothetical protein
MLRGIFGNGYDLHGVTDYRSSIAIWARLQHARPHHELPIFLQDFGYMKAITTRFANAAIHQYQRMFW